MKIAKTLILSHRRFRRGNDELWKYYDLLLFLKDIVKPRKTTSNLRLGLEGDVEMSSPSTSSGSATSSVSASSSVSATSAAFNLPSTPAGGRKRKPENDHMTAKIIDALDALKQPQYMPDEVDAFCTRLAGSLRRLPCRQRTQLEINFLQQVYEVEEELGLMQ